MFSKTYKYRCARCEKNGFLDHFLSGTLAFSWFDTKTCEHSAQARGNLEDDWYCVGRDIYSASEKYRADRG
jgi:hypothetical protein